MQIDNSWLQHKGTREEGGSSNNNGGRKAPSIKIPYPPPHPKCAVRKDYRIASLVGGKMRPRKKAPLSGRKTFFRLETQAGSFPPPPPLIQHLSSSLSLLSAFYTEHFSSSSSSYTYASDRRSQLASPPPPSCHGRRRTDTG